MTQRSTLNPVALYESVLERTKETLVNVRPEQLQDPTPCSDWNVSVLMDHIVDGTRLLLRTLGGDEPHQALPGGDKGGNFEMLATGALHLAQQPGAMEREYDTRMGRLLGAQFLMAMCMEVVIHRWDLAKATGQDTTIDQQHAEAIHDAFKDQVPFMREIGVVGPEVKVSENAPVQERLLGLLGRKA